MAQKFNPFTGNFDTVLDKSEEIKYDNTASALTADNVQEALDEIDSTQDAVVADVADLVTLSGRPANSTNLGTFTGATITDNSTVKTALQELETALEGIPTPITYKGTYNATTNSPALANSDTGKTGWLYQVAVAGSQDFGAGSISFEVGDKVVNNGSTWDKWDMTDAVTSVNGQAGVVVLDTADISENSNLYFTDERAQDAVGTILTDSSSVDFTYNDGSPSITAVVLPAGVDKNSLGGSALTIANGGTGQTSANAALNALLPSQTSQSGKFLTTDGTDTSWASGSSLVAVSTKTTTYTLQSSDDVILADASSAAFTLTLPAAASVTGKKFIIKKIDSGFNQVTIDGNSSETIDGSADRKLSTQYESITIVSDGTNWQLLDRRIPSGWTSFTPTGSWTGGNVTYTGKWRRDGDTVHITGSIALTGAPTGAALTVTLPNSWTVDTNKLDVSGGALTFIESSMTTLLDSGTAQIDGKVGYSSTTVVSIFYNAIAASRVEVGSVNATAPWTWANGDAIKFSFSLPITGWEG
jgi:hypothetical protein